MASSAATCLGVFLLTGNTIMAIRRSRADDDDAAATAAIAVTSYASLLLLFYCLRRFETSPIGSAAKARSRAGVWLTTTLLTAMFSWRVSAIMPWWPVSAAVCFIGAATVLGGFYALFLAPTTGD